MVDYLDAVARCMRDEYAPRFGSNAPWSNALPAAFGISMRPTFSSGMIASRRCDAK